MKLVFKQTKEGRITADFKGDLIEAVDTIIHAMNKSEAIEAIIITAAAAYPEFKKKLEDEIKDFKVKEITKKSQQPTAKS